MKTYLKVADLVGQALFELGEQGTHLYESALYHALQFVKKANADQVVAEPQLVCLPIDKATRTVLLPADYIDYTRVGEVVAGVVTEIPNLRKLKGTPEDGKGFRVDESKLSLTSEVQGEEVVLEYIHSGLNPTCDTLVHPYLEEPLIRFVIWKLQANRRNVPQGEKAMAMQLYHNAYRKANALASRFNETELKRALLK